MFNIIDYIKKEFPNRFDSMIKVTSEFVCNNFKWGLLLYGSDIICVLYLDFDNDIYIQNINEFRENNDLGFKADQINDEDDFNVPDECSEKCIKQIKSGIFNLSLFKNR
jgi:hypothetical protein